jgi:VanZ family protein
MTSSPGGRTWINRSGYALVAALWALFVAYGSLVPFRFASLSFGVATQRFLTTLQGPVLIDSRADFVTNILLTVPLGYFALAALRTDRRGVVGHLIAAIGILPACFAYSAAVEFAQVYFPIRTDSLSDIVAQAGGSVVGVALWLAAGGAVTEWMRASLRERERPALVQRLLLLYCIVFVIAQVMPLDLTLSLGQLARKYRNGRVLIVPFSYPYASHFDMIWDYAGDVALNFPIGCAAALLWTFNRARRTYPRALLLAISAVGAIELAQVFVNSRVADITDVITGSVGAALGVFVAGYASQRQIAMTGTQPAARPNSLVWPARVASILWVLVLASYHWSPYNFTTASDQITIGMHQLMSIPFSSYYAGSELHALTEMLRKFLLALPSGVFLQLSGRMNGDRGQRRRRGWLAAAIGAAVLTAIEFGQVFLPSRVADMTDVIVAEAGLLVGVWLSALFASLSVTTVEATDVANQHFDSAP